MASWRSTRYELIGAACLFAAGTEPCARPAAQEPRVTVGGPMQGARPGVVRLHGAVTGEAPLSVRVDGEPARTEAAGRWWIELELGIGEHHLRIAAEDGAGRAAQTIVHDLLVYPGFRPNESRALVRVSDAQALVDAIAPDRILVLDAGAFDLGAVEPGEHPYVAREGKAGNLRLREVVQLDIIGAAGRGSSILTRGANQTTLVLDDCSHVRFHGLRLAHEETEGTGGGVLNLRQCYDVWLYGCELTGGGLGLAMLKVNRVRLEGCLVRECTRGILRLKNSKHLRFADTEFVRNGLGRSGDYGVVITGGERRDQVFVRCRFLENRPDPLAGLFELDAGSTEVYFLEGEILRNQTSALASGAGAGRLRTRESRVQRFEPRR